MVEPAEEIEDGWGDYDDEMMDDLQLIKGTSIDEPKLMRGSSFKLISEEGIEAAQARLVS